MSNVKVISPYFQQNGGDSVLSAIDLSSPNAVKEITFHNEGDSAEELGFTYETEDTGTYLGPKGLSSEIDNTIDKGQYITTFVSSSDNMYAKLEFVSSTGNLTTDTGQEYVPVEVSNSLHLRHNSRDMAHMHNFNGTDYTISQNSSPMLDENTSFMILRTNPKLTGNVKLTVDSTNSLWLNTMDANKELADSRFKRVHVNPSSSYSIDIFNFFDKGKTPPEIVYDVYNESSSYFSTQTSLSKQHDRFYTSGGYQLVDKMYDEDFAYFAPIRLQENLPDYFVIFKVEGSYNEFTYTDSTANWNTYVKEQILKGAKTVKTFDMTEKSNLGKYIRNIVNHPARKAEEMTVSLQESSYTTFNGIAYNKGSYAQMGEILGDYFSIPNPQIGVEEYLTLGFERNKLVSSSILNLEFLFNDEQASDYEINRYFGLYLSKNELANFHLSLTAMRHFSSDDEQYPALPRAYSENYVIKSFVQENDNGIKLYVDSSTLEFNDIDVYSARVEYVNPEYLIFDGDWSTNRYLKQGNRISVKKDSYEEKILTVTLIEQYDTYAKIYIDNDINSVYTGGIATFIDDALNSSRNIEKFYIPEDGNRLFYLQDKKGSFYTVNSTSVAEANIGSLDTHEYIRIELNNTKIDVSDFTGEKSILSQTKAEVSNSKGHSVAELEFISTLKNGDSITIDWFIPSSQEPMRWKIFASSNYVDANDVWPEASILTDDDGGKYYSVIFNPGDIDSYEFLSDELKSLYLTKMAATVKKAFDTCPFKIFEVIASGNKVYFRSKEPGESSNSIFVRTLIATESIKSMGIYAPVGHYVDITDRSFPFMGGSDKLKNRAKIATDVAAGIGKDEYFKVKGSFSPLSTYTIWGNEVNYFPSLTEPVYEDDTLVDFADKGTYSIIELKVDSSFDTTYDSKITSYDMFKTSFGVFSIFPVKDFDNDYFSSDYRRTYDAELVHFFDNEGVFNITSINTSGKVTFDRAFGKAGEFNFLGIYDDIRTPKNFNGKVKLYFPGEGLDYAFLMYYKPSETTEISDYGIGVENEISKVVILESDQELYFEEGNLATFKGFFTLDNQISEDSLNELRKKTANWDFTRFTTEHTNSEYLRNYENFTTEYALTSKVVPYIAKWVSTGRDIRDNQYRFNFNRAFGTMNFSPSSNVTEPDPRYHTHEWSYIGNIPHYISRENYKDLFSYMFDNTDNYDFTSVERDWFIEYFSIGYPTEKILVPSEVYSPIPRTQKFSTFKYDAIEEKTYTMFRGVKINVSDLVDGNYVDHVKYDGYKFSSVIVSTEEDDRKINEPVEIDIIINEKFKFIVNVIKIRLSSYKNPNSEISYLDLYTMQNRRDRATYLTYDVSKMYISPLITSISDFEFNVGVPADTILDSKMSLDSGEIWYQHDNDKRILPLNTGVYSHIYSIYTSSGYTQELTVVTQDIMKFNTSNITFYDGYTYIFDPEINFSYPAIGTTSDFWLNMTNYYSQGGDNLYLHTQKMLSFYELSNALSMNSTKIQPNVTHVYTDGSFSDTTNMRLKFIDPEKILQNYDLVSVSDNDKPSQLYSHDIIGVELMTMKNQQYIYRYQGDFTPKFRNLFNFAGREDKQFCFSHNNDFKFRNTHLVVNSESYINKNCYYNKVADKEILNVPLSSGYKSLYPLVDEISIDRKDEFIWNSTWDNMLYEKYTSTKDYTTIKGTNEMTEYKSFMGSKMMKVPRDFTLYEFSSDEYELQETVTDGVIKYIIKIDVGARLQREMLGTEIDKKARKEFYRVSQVDQTVIADSETEDKCKSYIQSNLLGLYNVTNVNFYLLETGSNKSLRDVIETSDSLTLSEAEILRRKYTLKKDINSQIDNLVITLEVLPDDRFFTSVGFGVDITRI